MNHSHECSKNFFLASHKVFIRIQEVMMKHLNCASWDEVKQNYPTTRLTKALSEFFLAFQNYKRAKEERMRIQLKDSLAPMSEYYKTFTCLLDPIIYARTKQILSVHWVVS
ncbi:hypothetical protein O6H91_03G049200 [Diphasiastrum complanatum]|uniref:Uncharacterized protein n=1 Tax=Diphasiastrum complanatum TaxID=34168 RepID=A0ACC2E6E0_DIPCM|nr:hypothetical protein O6H91_03G049200 [Diphasiastrum complanatum]